MITYRSAGVSIDAGDELVRRIKKITGNRKGMSGIGGFSGLVPLPGANQKQFLSGCCDGVGTKLKLAFLTGVHDTVGIDLVAMNVNDLICSGARPLFFLDYFACGKLDVKIAEQVIRGVQNGCEQSQCILLGGETAEMPGFYESGEYDLAGFAVGIADKKNLFKPDRIKPGDVILGLPSSGLHSNGYSLVRKLFSESELKKMRRELLMPTRIYVKDVLPLITERRWVEKGLLKGMAHITGGGWTENIPRVLPKNADAIMHNARRHVPELFDKIQKRAKLPDAEMFRTFNMGIGLVLVLDKKCAAEAQKILKSSVVLGEIARGRQKVVFA